MLTPFNLLQYLPLWATHRLTASLIVHTRSVKDILTKKMTQLSEHSAEKLQIIKNHSSSICFCFWGFMFFIYTPMIETGHLDCKQLQNLSSVLSLSLWHLQNSNPTKIWSDLAARYFNPVVLSVISIYVLFTNATNLQPTENRMLMVTVIKLHLKS